MSLPLTSECHAYLEELEVPLALILLIDPRYYLLLISLRALSLIEQSDDMVSVPELAHLIAEVLEQLILMVAWAFDQHNFEERLASQARTIVQVERGTVLEEVKQEGFEKGVRMVARNQEEGRPPLTLVL
jgi:hypothetical protein